MRIETVKAWLFVGFCLLTIGALLYISRFTEGRKLAIFLAAMGLIYFGIGIASSVMHDRHMLKRTRAAQE